jgi:DNA-binding transcriptional LysR family regulator
MKQAAELNWEDLRYFLRAARAKSLAGAARTLGVEQSSVDLRLSALESTMASALVQRGPESLTLTPLGERVLALAEDMERTASAVQKLVRSQHSGVRLAVPSGFANLIIAALPRLTREQPDVKLQLLSGARAVDLKQGEAELALRSTPSDDSGLLVRKLLDVGYSLYATDTYLRRAPKVDLADLSGHVAIGYHAALAATPAAQWLEGRSGQLRTVLRSRDFSETISAAVGGVGIAILPCMFADSEPRLKRLTDELVVTQPLSLVYRPEARQSPMVRTVARFIVRVVAEHAAQLRGTRDASTEKTPKTTTPRASQAVMTEIQRVVAKSIR